jgi:uncharacterized membrane protein
LSPFRKKKRELLMTKNSKTTLSDRLVRLGLIIGGLGLSTSAALAQNVGEIAESLADQTGNIADLISIIAFVLGVGMAIAGFMKFRQNAQNPNDPSAKISTAFILIFVGAGLVAIPAALGSGIATVFGGGAQQTDANTGFRAVGN